MKRYETIIELIIKAMVDAIGEALEETRDEATIKASDVATAEALEETRDEANIKASDVATAEASEETRDEANIKASDVAIAEALEETRDEAIIKASDVATAEASEETRDEAIIKASDVATVEVLEKTGSKTTIKAMELLTASGYSTNYVNPLIPEGYKHVCGEWNNGFTIERCSDRSQFVWIPVGSLDANGKLDEEHLSEKFGRRTYYNHDKLSYYQYDEPLEGELLEQFESVKKYGGFYISRYNISINSVGKPQSVKGVMPWVDGSFHEAKMIASTIEDNKVVKSHLTFGAEYDSILEWIHKTKAKTFYEIVENSTEWGNHATYKLAKTGSREEWCVNNIYDLAGNVSEWTQEYWRERLYRVIRGGNYRFGGAYTPVAARFGFVDFEAFYRMAGFRVALCIK